MTWNKKISKPRKKPDHYESRLQASCVKWFKLQYPKVVIAAIPNGGARSKTEAAIMKGEGVRAGVADLFIAKPTRIGLTVIHCGLFIEMKTITGKQSPAQKQFQKDIEEVDYLYRVCSSFDQFKKVVEDYLE